MTHIDPTGKEQRGLDPRAFLGGGQSRSVSTGKQLRCCLVSLAVLLALPAGGVICNFLNSL